MELSFDQLEEGEIRDDDFEDISDNSESLDSLVDLSRGKFDSTNESLRALSLSSVSADDDAEKTAKKPRYYHLHNHHHHHHAHAQEGYHKKLHHHHHRHHRKKRVCPLKRRASSSHSSSSSEEDARPDDELKIKLKEAVRIECSVKRNIQLKQRLNLMHKEPEQEPEPELKQEPNKEQNKEQPEPLAQIRDNLQTTQEIINSEKIEDSDLEALRCEALKTAVLNKHMMRKKRKLEALQATKTLPDKENEPEEPVAVQEQDEDLDALRANLLANLRKKAPSPKQPVAEVAPQPVPKPQATKVTKQFKTHVIVNNTTKKINKVRPLPIPCVVAPLIISIGGDSDSDEPLSKTLPTAPPAPSQPDMSRIDQLLAESRARAEAMQLAAAAASEAVQLAKVTPQKPPQQLLPPTAPKSAVKLLPKSQQIEYQQLLRKLKTAEERKKRKLVRAKTQIAKKIGPPPPPPPPPEPVADPPRRAEAEETPSPVQNGIAKESKAAPVCDETHSETNSVADKSEPVENSTERSNKAEEEATPRATEFTVEQVIEDENKKSGVLKDVAVLHGLLKEIRTNRNGRLQMRGKYHVLTPVVKKIMDVNNERKKHEAHIRDLMEGLMEFRRQLANTHEKFSSLVGELADRKRSVDITKVRAAVQSKKAVTPLKNRSEAPPPPPPVTSTPTLHINPCAINSQVEDMDVCNSEDNSDMCHHIDIMDPNDIDQIFPRKQFPHHLNFPEYVSPLNNCGRYNFVDPQGVMCPFELAGFCRDTECTFKHYLLR